jgi:mannose-binding lectin 2
LKDSSRAKIEITPENGLIISIDARSSGEWTECVSIPNLPLPAEWTRAAHIGITASTGQLADNHDVISFIAYDNNQVLMHSYSLTQAPTHSLTY